MKVLYHLLVALACLTIVSAGGILLAARWRWIRFNTWVTWRENRLWKEADRHDKHRRAEALAAPPAVATGVTQPEPFVVYSMADGGLIYDEFNFVTDLEFFDDRDREERLVKRTYVLVSEEPIVLPDPYPIEDEDDDAEPLPGPPDPPTA